MKKCFIFESRIFSSGWYIYAFFLVFRIYVLSFSLSLSSVFCRIFPCLQLLCFVVLFPCLWLLCFVEYFLVFVFYVFSFSFYLSFVFRRIFPCLWLSCFVVYFFVLGLVRPSLLLPHWIQCVISLSIKNSVLLPSFSFSSEEMGCQNKSSIIWIKRDFLQVLIKSLHSLLQEGFLHRGKILLLFLLSIVKLEFLIATINAIHNDDDDDDDDSHYHYYRHPDPIAHWSARELGKPSLNHLPRDILNLASSVRASLIISARTLPAASKLRLFQAVIDRLFREIIRFDWKPSVFRPKISVFRQNHTLSPERALMWYLGGY